RNLLLLNPLCVLLIAGAIGWIVRRRPPGRWFGATAWLVVACGVVALLIHWLSFQPQFNMQWIVLLLPLHAALAFALRRRGLPPPRR
ncbi:MAG TPA: hypothetical protein DDZ67_06805, partial [Xanthomonadaceae bacterium]|nr:hypothetical protein [Xanthomonadaceae bacterium]